MRDGRPPRFKVFQAPRATAIEKRAGSGRFRESPRERGYDARWDRLSIAFRKQNPFCAWCAQAGRDTWCELVDHIIPAVDRDDLRYEWKNLQSLCRFHHARKTQMEAYARINGLLDELPAWCADPALRANYAKR